MRLLVTAVLIAITVALTGCGGGSSSEPAPSNLKVVAGDSSATVIWDVDSSFEYWVWVNQGTTVDPLHCSTCRVFVNVFPPYIVTPLANGTTYSVTVNARKEGGAGGAGSPAQTIVPRLAGATWEAGAPLSASNLLGVDFTSATTAGLSTIVEVGANGAAFWSLDGGTWNVATTNVPGNLNAVHYSNGVFVVIGDSGAIITSPDGSTWTPRAAPTTNALTAIAGNGQGHLVAVGRNGTVLQSSDAGTWTASNSGTPEDLYGVAFGNGRYVAVGAHGALVSSTDGTNWTPIAAVTGADLHGITYGSLAATSTTPAVARFIAVGTGGTVLTSTDGLAWSVVGSLTDASLASVAFGTQFIAVGAGGAIFTSVDGLAWQPADSGTTTDLNAVAFTILTAHAIGVGYAAVGDAGTNLTSF